MYIHPVVTTTSSTIRIPTRAPVAGIALFKGNTCTVTVHVSGTGVYVGRDR